VDADTNPTSIAARNSGWLVGFFGQADVKKHRFFAGTGVYPIHRSPIFIQCVVWCSHKDALKRGGRNMGFVGGAGAGCGVGFTSVGIILVLYILLVIIVRPFGL
jgi:hypothetical protein